MGLSIIKSFSILIAAGKGQKCNGLKAALRTCLISSDPETGLSKVFLHKNGRNPEYKKDSLRISKEVGKLVKEFLGGTPNHFFGPDGSKPKPEQVN